MRVAFISTKQECPECKSTDLILVGFDYFFCKNCGKSGQRKGKKLSPRVTTKDLIQKKERFKDPTRKFWQSTNPSYCPKCNSKLKKTDSIYNCNKCGFFENVEKMEDSDQEPKEEEQEDFEESHDIVIIPNKKPAIKPDFSKVDILSPNPSSCPICQAFEFYAVQNKIGLKSKFMQCKECGNFEKYFEKKNGE